MRPSLTRRLLMSYFVTILIIGGSAGGLVWMLMSRALQDQQDEALRAEALALIGRLDEDGGLIEFESGVVNPLDSPKRDVLIQIIDEHGRIVFSSPQWQSDRSLSEKTPMIESAGSPFWFTSPAASTADDYRIVAMQTFVPFEEPPASPTDQQQIGAWIFVGRSRAPLAQALNQLATVLTVALAFGAVATLLGGVWVARQVARPINAVAAAIGRINPADPEITLDRNRVPVELEPVIATIERLMDRIRTELVRQRQLTADVAHDLRTPIAGVRTLLDVCVQRGRTADEYIQTVDKARAALRQLSHLLDNVLTLSRLDAGVDQPIFSCVSLDEVLVAAIATVQPLATARGVRIESARTPAIEFPSDRDRLLKILGNLLSNAVEHSPAGSPVRIIPRIEQNAVVLAVEDLGPGVPVALRDRIFERFVRGDTARSTASGHHGLGLPIAAQLAKSLGGSVTIDVTYDRGGRFIVRLPTDVTASANEGPSIRTPSASE